MKTKTYHTLGVMSGTSLDGIDLAACRFNCHKHQWTFSIDAVKTLSYPQYWSEKLKNVHRLSRDELLALDDEYTLFLGQIIKKFVDEHALNIDAVASHGHTVWHQPERRLTYQIGNRPELANYTKQTTVCDFRVGDVELGGQGAPLVPIGDRLLFGNFEACLNLGGFANISREENGNRQAFDIGAANTVLNALAEKKGKKFDAGGQLAASGKVDESLKQKLDQLDFYTKLPPKSLGIEWVHKVVFPLLNKSELAVEDQLQTYTQHITDKIADHLPRDRSQKTLVTGGGAFNTYFIERLRRKTDSEIYLPSENLIDYKEALIFAFLGVLRLRGDTNVLKSVTGASRDHSTGKIFQPQKA